MSTRHERAAEEFAARARGALGESIHEVIRYGSTIRGETRGRDSDVDMFVVLNDPEREDKLRDIAYDVGLEFGLVVSVQTQTRERFEERRDGPFVRTVLREGRSYG
jgi:predicted nucleotidyltransferase